MTDTTARLHRIAATLRTGGTLLPEDAGLLASALETVLGTGAHLDEAFGLVPPSPFSAEMRARRAALIRRLAAFYDGSLSGVAKQMAMDARSYAVRCWPRLRNQDEPPPHHQGKAEAVLFLLHREHDDGWATWPLGWRSIYDILRVDLRRSEAPS